MSEPPITVITVTYNSSRDLQRFWHRPADDARPYTWIVVDNASVDGSANIARNLGATVVELDENVGFSAANNLAAARVDNGVVVFCNPDVEVTDIGLRQLASDAITTGHIVAPQLLNEDGSPQENGRGTPFPWRKLMHRVGRSAAADRRYHRTAEVGELVEVVWVMGAAVAMSLQTFRAVGGWDERYFVYYEDSDICLRAIRHGFRVILNGDVRWRHGWARATGSGFSIAAWRHELRSGLQFYARHPHCVVALGPNARRVRAIDRSS